MFERSLVYQSLVFKAFAAATLGMALAAQPAHALQPLQEFLAGARSANPDALEAAANANQQDALADVQLGRALPGLQLRGTYTHNQYDSKFTLPTASGQPPITVMIQPYDAFDAYSTINVPLIDLAQFKRIAVSRTGAAQTRKQMEAVQLQISGAVAQDYFQLVANLALVEASKRQLEVSRTSLALIEDKFRLGSAPELEVDRAKSEVERQVQQLAAAELQREISARALTSASGIAPQLTAGADFPEDLHAESPLDELERSIDALPQTQVAKLATDAADGTLLAQKLTLVPALSGSFSEHVSNAAGFVGSNSSYFYQLALNWNFDFTNIANIRAAQAASEAARARELRSRLAAGDEISRDWNSVRAAIARSQSARVEVKTSQHAADLAFDRYRAGASTQLELLQAQRDAFSAEVSRIQADADLANSRAQLRLSVGQSLDQTASSITTRTPPPSPAPQR